MIATNIILIVVVLFGFIYLGGSFLVAVRELITFLKESKTIDINENFRDSAIRENAKKVNDLNKEVEKLWDWVHGEQWEGTDWKDS